MWERVASNKIVRKGQKEVAEIFLYYFWYMKNEKIKIVIGVLAIIGIIGLVILVFQGLLKGFSFLSSLIPVYVSVSFIVLGILSIVAGKLFLRKKNVYKKIAPNNVVLETPLYADLIYIAGVLLIGLGLLTFSPGFSYLKGDKFFLGFMILLILVMMVVMVLRLMFSLNDKIEITSQSIHYDDPNTKSKLTIEQSQIVEILHLKTFSFSRYGYSESSYSFELFIKYNNLNNEQVVLELKPQEMNLNLDLLLDSLVECSYPILLRSKKSLEENEWEGHHFIED